MKENPIEKKLSEIMANNPISPKNLSSRIAMLEIQIDSLKRRVGRLESGANFVTFNKERS